MGSCSVLLGEVGHDLAFVRRCAWQFDALRRDRWTVGGEARGVEGAGRVEGLECGESKVSDWWFGVGDSEVFGDCWPVASWVPGYVATGGLDG